MEDRTLQIQELTIDRSRYDISTDIKNKFVAKPGVT
jgi:hypothetical protein